MELDTAEKARLLISAVVISAGITEETVFFFDERLGF